MNQESHEDWLIVKELESGDLVRMKAAIKRLRRKYEGKVCWWVYNNRKCRLLSSTELGDVWEDTVTGFVMYVVRGKVSKRLGTLLPLLKTIAFRRAIDIRRRRPKHRTDSLDQIPESVVPPASSGSTQACDLLFDLRDVMETFSKIQREVWLAYADSRFTMTFDELLERASARAGKRLSPKALKHHLQRGRELLAFWLENLRPDLAAGIWKRDKQEPEEQEPEEQEPEEQEPEEQEPEEQEPNQQEPEQQDSERCGPRKRGVKQDDFEKENQNSAESNDGGSGHVIETREH